MTNEVVLDVAMRMFVPSEGDYYMNKSIGMELARQCDLGQVS